MPFTVAAQVVLPPIGTLEAPQDTEIPVMLVEAAVVAVIVFETVTLFMYE